MVHCGQHWVQELGRLHAHGETHQIRLGISVLLSNRRDTITVLDDSDLSNGDRLDDFFYPSNGDRMIDQVSYEARDVPEEGHMMVV